MNFEFRKDLRSKIKFMKKIILVLSVVLVLSVIFCLSVFFLITKKESNFLNEKKQEKIENNNRIDLGGGYFKEKNQIYFEGFKVMNVENVDIDSFKVISNDYAKDKNNVYYYGHIARYSKNDSDIYSGDDKLIFDYQTFDVLNDFYFKDKDNVYFVDCQSNIFIKVNEADAKSFEILNFNLAKDKNNIYFVIGGDGACYYEKIEKVDFKTLEIFNEDYFKDRNNCYEFGKVVPMSKCDEIEKSNF